MARAFPHGLPMPHRAVTPDGEHNAHVDGPRVFLDGGEVYDGTRDVDPERGFFPCNQVVPAVALSEDGKRVLFQVPTDLIMGGAPIAIVMKAELKKGWWGKQSVEVEPMVNLPQRATAMALKQDGTFAYGADGAIFENPTGSEHDWSVRAEFGQDQVVGMQYLADGALAVATQAPDRELPRYWLLAGGQPEEVPLEKFAPEGKERFEWLKVRWTGAKFEQMDAFRAANPGLFDAEGKVREHAACASPSQRQALICTLGKAGQALLYDVASGSSRSLGQLDVTKLDRAYWDVDRSRAGILSGQDLHVFDLEGKGNNIVLPGLKDLEYAKSDGSLTFLAPGQTEKTRVGIEDAHTLRSAPWYEGAFKDYQARLQGELLGSPVVEKPRTGIQEDAQSVSIGGTRLKRRGG
jgi:hypothetical protein